MEFLEGGLGTGDVIMQLGSGAVWVRPGLWVVGAGAVVQFKSARVGMGGHEVGEGEAPRFRGVDCGDEGLGGRKEEEVVEFEDEGLSFLLVREGDVPKRTKPIKSSAIIIGLRLK